MNFGDQQWQHMYVGNNRESTCLLGSNVDTHLCWKINGAENAHRILAVDKHLCLRSKMATRVYR